MKNTALKSLIPIVAAGIAFISPTFALSQATDSETSMITLTFTENIDIAFVDNLDLVAPPSGTPQPILAEDTFCVAGVGFNFFSITFTNPASATGDFQLMPSVAGTAPINYEVFFKNDTSPGPGVPVTPNAPIGGNMIQATSCPDISFNNAKFDIEIPFSQWDGRDADSPFTGMLQITVVAE
ncbi:hypothetical protein [Microbulbifer sp. JMSA008]|uniref:hypothetical protein n=1 Tax=Microbulbifer sp. JMSA008 TaxID=3243373 RepID=UPI004039F0B6